MLHVDSPEISAGDSVMVTMDPDMFKLAQQDYGGWDDSMAEVKKRSSWRLGKAS